MNANVTVPQAITTAGMASSYIMKMLPSYLRTTTVPLPGSHMDMASAIGDAKFDPHIAIPGPLLD
jgi:hypothetical protein